MYCLMDKKNFVLMSHNVNGLYTYARRVKFASAILYNTNGPRPDIICLQETHSEKHVEDQFRNHFQYECYFKHFDSTMGGLLTGFRRGQNLQVHDQFSFQKGSETNTSECLMIHCTLDEIEMVIVNSYTHCAATVTERTEFLSHVERELPRFGCANIICAGDFNAILNADKDRTAGWGEGRNARLYSEVLQAFVENTELVDVFRVLNPMSRRVTCFTAGHASGARLDYIFASGFFANRIIESSIHSKVFSDHNHITVQIETGVNERGPGYWRFPNMLLKNEHFVEDLKSKIKQVVNIHKETSTPDILWETVKCAIRTEVGRFLKKDSSRDKIIMEELEARLALLHIARDEALMISSRRRYNNDIVEVTQELVEYREKVNRKRLEFNTIRKKQEDEKSSNISSGNSMQSQEVVRECTMRMESYKQKIKKY